MLVSERSVPEQNRRIQVLCALICSLCAGLAVWAFRLSTDVVGTAAAQGQRPHMMVPAVKLAVASDARNSAALFNESKSITSAPAQVAPAPHSQRPVEPVLIARASPAPDQSAPATAVEDASADVDEWAGYEPWVPGRADTFRTVCVRLCDGAYFPISFSTTRSRFKADAARCQSGCSSPARLFVVKPEGDPEDMVDVRGAAYADLPNAFKFRTAYDASCTCRGQPWDVEARERHRQMAAAEEAQQSVMPDQPTTRLTMLPPAIAPLHAHVTTTKPSNVHVQVAALDPSANDTAVPNRGAAVPPVTHVDERGPKKSPRAAVTGRPAPVKAEAKPPVQGLKPGAVKKPQPASAKMAHTTVVVRTNQRTVLAQASDRSGQTQRSFRSSDYWRLSVWDRN